MLLETTVFEYILILLISLFVSVVAIYALFNTSSFKKFMIVTAFSVLTVGMLTFCIFLGFSS